jgi:hypothetical protein
MWIDQACDALARARVLELRYDGFSRWVEVHAVGISKADHTVMRCWQIRGGSVHNEPVGWKLMRLDEAHSAFITDEMAQAPRPGYRRDDSQMTRIICQII